MALLEGKGARIGWVEYKKVGDDGESAHAPRPARQGNWVYVEPGRRRVSISTDRGGGTGWVTFTHEFRAGGHYIISADTTDGLKAIIREQGVTGATTVGN